MNGINISVLITFIIYLAAMLGIGFFFYAKSNNLSDYFLGGRQLNSWVTALSAQASDMSGWLLMGLPAAAYWSGISAGWIAIGLGLGTYFNWKVVASRLRRFTAVSGDSITIPEYLQNRFKSKSVAVRSICAVIIFIFFLVYTASAFNAGAKLFQYVFNLDYVLALTIGAVIIISYTFLGGFLAVCWTDFFQGILMFFAIVIVPVVAAFKTPDLSVNMLTSLGGSGFLSLFSGVTFATVISSLAWGLGYFGMPHILTRFMAIKSSSMIKKSRIIAMVWVAISLTAAIAVGVVGFGYMESAGIAYASKGAAEIIFMDLATKLMPPLLTGVLLSAILAAVMSTADSQLLVTASAVSNDFYKALFRKNASDKELMLVSRISVLVIAAIAYLIALDPNSSVMGLVSYAWAGFGAAFGPVILLSLFWRRMTLKGAVAGMVSGGACVLIWETLKLEATTSIYSLIPGFALSLLCVFAFSKLDKEPGDDVKEIFEKAKAANI
ncbi:sodium/proline symporter PutP [Zongyangia hominis]|uniref:Sodium/proline symporter n=1 Tax=Zongyangia hominis TaxID=2763677 RepID=A0A926EC28_9FIRM|nr:sodium/proline symporter PutP [Zongyangia hominis]MBC8569376.1 sodium/proline symporter PutP [Zongyangia hominis]